MALYLGSSTKLKIASSENKNFYAHYTPFYTVNFYSEGVLVDTVRVAKGQTAIHKELSKEGCQIKGYNPSNKNITANTDIEIKWGIEGEILDDWDVIKSYCEDGSYVTRYKVGDAKLLDITYSDGTIESIPMYVAEMRSDVLKYYKYTDDNTKNAKMIFVAGNLLKDNYKMQSTQLTGQANVKWINTELASYLNNDFISCLPIKLQNSLQDITTIDSWGTSRQNGKLWTLYLKELTGKKITYPTSFSSCDNMTSYINQFELFSSGLKDTLFKKNNNDSFEDFWLSNVAIYVYNPWNIKNFYYTTNKDVLYTEYGKTTKGVLLAFCIG